VAVGGFRPEFDGAQDWDLFLRVTRGAEGSGVVHIPHVLYHWRAVESSTAKSIEAKPSAVEAGTRAVADHLRAVGVEAEVEAFGAAFQRVRYAVPDPAPSVEVIIPSACKHDYVQQCLEGLLRGTSYPELHVTIVVSDTVRADDAAAALLEEATADPRVDVLVYPSRPFNYSWVNNFAVSRTTSQIICLMNDDLLVTEPNWLRAMVGQVVQDRVAAVGAMLYYPDDRVQHGGVILGLGGIANHYHRLLRRGAAGYRGRAWCDQDLSCVTAGCMVLRREAFLDVGGFDEMFAVAFNDVDFCIRLREKGWRIVWTPTAELYHYESTSIGRHDAPERAPVFAHEIELANARWNGMLQADPYYNPNLSLVDMNELAFPPRQLYPWRITRHNEPGPAVSSGNATGSAPLALNRLGGRSEPSGLRGKP
jgi:GT2 family glycosyltransferase